jgi:outer membrane protein OmpA-like peptidoglycan-associated protein
MIKISRIRLTKAFVSGGCLILFLSAFLCAQSVPPTIELRVDPAYISPNDDKLNDQAFFYPVLRSKGDAEGDVTRWQLDIRTIKKKKVQRLSGSRLDAMIPWDGKDRKGRGAKDGEYIVTFKIWMGKHKAKSEPISVFVDTNPPQVGLTISTNVFQMSPDGINNIVFQPAIIEESPIEEFKYEIFGENDEIVYVWETSGPVRAMDWDGINTNTGVLIPRGSYHGGFSALDAAGNQSEKVFVEFTVDISAQEMLSHTLENILVYETDIGLIVQLPANGYFGVIKGKPFLLDEAMPALREVAILINAYPDVPVALDGYAWQFKSVAKDKDLSSRFAWAIYSFLVKQGKVKASRLKPKGRARSPMFSRREVDDPPEFVTLQNGVEVILEGNRDWSE